MTEQEILDQMQDIDLSKIETSFPMLATGMVTANIGKCELRRDVDKKGDDAKPYWFLEYSLTQPWKTVAWEGTPSKPVNPGDRGSKLQERIYIGKYIDKNDGTEKWYGLDRLTKMREAVFGKAPEGTRFVAPEMIGQDIILSLTFNPKPMNKDTKETYGPRTEISGYVKKGK